MLPLLLLTLVLQQSLPAPTAAWQPQSTAPRIEWAPLPRELPQEFRDSVRFGYLAVPQDHADPGGRRIRIAFVVLPARSAIRLPDPVVSIAGGPGLPAIALHLRLRRDGPHPLDAYRARRDLIVIDARGHGFSEPHTCPELHGAEPLTEEMVTAERLWLAKLQACRMRLQDNGVRLETLSSVQAAHDLELLRRALGAPQLNLVGLSYGSRIAAEATRVVPSAIRAVYVSGPVPAGHFGHQDQRQIAEEVLGTLFRRCASRPTCSSAYPRLAADYDSVLARLRRRPERIPVPRSDAAPEGSILVTETLMRQGFAQLLLNRQLAAGAPLLIHTLAQEGLAPLRAMATQLIGAIGDAEVAPGTFLSFWCNDGVVSQASSEQLQQRCRTWLGEAWDGRPAEPVSSAVPALIETGELDPRTPPSFARFLASGLPRAQVVILPWYGHERPPECSLRISSAFFEAPDHALDRSCVDSIPDIDFVTGVVASRWFGHTVASLASRPWLAALPGTATLLLLVTVVGVPMHAIRVRRRGQLYRGRMVPGSLLVVAGLGLTLILGLVIAGFAGMRRHVFIPLIGLPKDWAWLLALPWLLLLLTTVAAVLALRGRSSLTGQPPAILRWSAFLGVTLLLAYCAASLF